MADSDFLKKLLVTFKIEAQEHVAALASGLVEIEKTASAQNGQQQPRLSSGKRTV